MYGIIGIVYASGIGWKKLSSYTSKIDQKDLAISFLVTDFANIMLETTFVGDNICW